MSRVKLSTRTAQFIYSSTRMHVFNIRNKIYYQETSVTKVTPPLFSSALLHFSFTRNFEAEEIIVSSNLGVGAKYNSY